MEPTVTILLSEYNRLIKFDDREEQKKTLENLYYQIRDAIFISDPRINPVRAHTTFEQFISQ